MTSLFGLGLHSCNKPPCSLQYKALEPRRTTVTACRGEAPQRGKKFMIKNISLQRQFGLSVLW